MIDAFHSATSIIDMVRQTSFSFNQSATCCGPIQKIVLQIGIGPIVGESSTTFPLPSLFDIFAYGCHNREDNPQLLIVMKSSRNMLHFPHQNHINQHPCFVCPVIIAFHETTFVVRRCSNTSCASAIRQK